MVEHLPHMSKAPGLILSTAERRGRERDVDDQDPYRETEAQRD